MIALPVKVGHSHHPRNGYALHWHDELFHFALLESRDRAATGTAAARRLELRATRLLLLAFLVGIG